ncbi:MAG TPA: IS200/IS605 family transposase [Longimicrobium sp.]|nr:IS200/IS605 family transposase [Longimicrobium sp.]
MAENRKGPHTVYNIQYHLVWVTKYRYPVLRGEVAERARELIRQTCMSREIKILKGHVSKDHVHLLLSCPPGLSPSNIAQSLKGRSSRLLQQEFSHLRKRYWGQHLWARGYFCSTTGEITTAQIQEYIERHRDEDPGERFTVDAE